MRYARVPREVWPKSGANLSKMLTGSMSALLLIFSNISAVLIDFCAGKCVDTGAGASDVCY
jgi:hypothetical protein